MFTWLAAGEYRGADFCFERTLQLDDYGKLYNKAEDGEMSRYRYVNVTVNVNVIF